MKEKWPVTFWKISFAMQAMSKDKGLTFLKFKISVCRANKSKDIIVLWHIPWMYLLTLFQSCRLLIYILGVMEIYRYWLWHSKCFLAFIPCTSSPMICTISYMCQFFFLPYIQILWYTQDIGNKMINKPTTLYLMC